MLFDRHLLLGWSSAGERRGMLYFSMHKGWTQECVWVTMERLVHIASGQYRDYFIAFFNQGHVNQPWSVLQNNFTMGLSGKHNVVRLKEQTSCAINWRHIPLFEYRHIKCRLSQNSMDKLTLTFWLILIIIFMLRPIPDKWQTLKLYTVLPK